MNTIKKKLDKLSRNKIYKICQKMKVKCQTNDNKKKMISKILLPNLHKYRMKRKASDIIDFSVLKIDRNTFSPTSESLIQSHPQYKYLPEHIKFLKGIPQLTIGIPLKDIPRLFERHYMNMAVKIGPGLEDSHKSLFKKLYLNMYQLSDSIISAYEGTDAYGLAILVASYINMFIYKPKSSPIAYDNNTGMKGTLLFMCRMPFSELYKELDESNKKYFKEFVKEAEFNLSDNVLTLYLDPEKPCGYKDIEMFYLPIADWLNSIIDPELGGKRSNVIDRYIQERNKKCNYKIDAKMGERRRDKFSFRDNGLHADFMSPPIPYINWTNQRDEMHSMGAYDVYRKKGQIQVLLECRECIGGKTVTIDDFERYGSDFINFYLSFARQNPFDISLKNYTIGFEYELSKGRKQKESTDDYKKLNMNNDGEIELPFNTGQMHYDYSKATLNTQEFISNPFTIEMAHKFSFKIFIKDIILFNIDNAMDYFSK